jgi:DNA repair protein RadA/Sms
MLLAVVQNRAALPVGKKDVFVNVAAGLRVSEPAADLGLALCIAGNLENRPLAEGTVVIGELGLVGEVRRVAQLERRLAEAARHGFRRAIVPAANSLRQPELEVVQVATLKEAIGTAFAPRVPSALNSD